MSWSVSCIGKPAAVAAHLDEVAAKQSGQSKVEFDAALPHLKALVAENFQEVGEPLLDFEASGSGYARSGDRTGEEVRQVQRTCTVSIKTLYRTVV